MIKKTIGKLKKLSPQRAILLYYLLALIIATLVLALPFFYQEYIPFIDVLFTAASALSVTGLSTVDIGTTFNLGGYIVLMLIMNIGGVGIMAMSTLIWVLLRQKISFRERMQIVTDMNQYRYSGAVKVVLNIIILVLFVEVIGAVIYFFHFYGSAADVGETVLHSVFLSVSATTNGGLDIFSNSLMEQADQYALQVPVMLQIIIGAIGYPVLIELKNYIATRKQKFRFSLFTKITTSMYGALFLLGAVLIFLLEWADYFKTEGIPHAVMNALFMSATSRSGGLSTVDLGAFNEATQLVMSALMFIGASPSSAGGGIRTTTFALILLFLVKFSRGRQEIHAFNRRIVRQDIDKAFAVITLALILVFSGVVSIVFLEDGQFGIIDVIFEVTSAFGTAGISTGITEDLSGVSKVIIMAFMFIGRIGFISFLLSIGGKQHVYNYHYPKERIMVG